MGASVPELDGIPPLPDGCGYLVEWFGELSSARGGNGFALGAIAYAEIAEWARLRGVWPTPWEVGVLRRIDAAFLEVIGDARSDERRNRRQG